MSLVILGFGKISIGILCVSLAILVLIIAYKKLLAYMDKGRISTEKYCVLYNIETESSAGEIEFYFTSEEKKHVKFDLLNLDMSLKIEIIAKDFPDGGNIVRFDSKQVENGYYFYQLLTDNQKTMKKIQILN